MDALNVVASWADSHPSLCPSAPAAPPPPPPAPQPQSEGIACPAAPQPRVASGQSTTGSEDDYEVVDGSDGKGTGTCEGMPPLVEHGSRESKEEQDKVGLRSRSPPSFACLIDWWIDCLPACLPACHCERHFEPARHSLTLSLPGRKPRQHGVRWRGEDQGRAEEARGGPGQDPRVSARPRVIAKAMRHTPTESVGAWG